MPKATHEDVMAGVRATVQEGIHPAYHRAAAKRRDVEPTRAARDVLAERRRQISAEGWTPEHDDEHDARQLAHAAACYAYPELTCIESVNTWPWAPEWFKVRDHRSNLVRAGALILAEIERIDRAIAKEKS